MKSQHILFEGSFVIECIKTGEQPFVDLEIQEVVEGTEVDSPFGFRTKLEAFNDEDQLRMKRGDHGEVRVITTHLPDDELGLAILKLYPAPPDLTSKKAKVTKN